MCVPALVGVPISAVAHPLKSRSMRTQQSTRHAPATERAIGRSDSLVSRVWRTEKRGKCVNDLECSCWRRSWRLPPCHLVSRYRCNPYRVQHTRAPACSRRPLRQIRRARSCGPATRLSRPFSARFRTRRLYSLWVPCFSVSPRRCGNPTCPEFIEFITRQEESRFVMTNAVSSRHKRCDEGPARRPA